MRGGCRRRWWQPPGVRPRCKCPRVQGPRRLGGANCLALPKRRAVLRPPALAGPARWPFILNQAATVCDGGRGCLRVCPRGAALPDPSAVGTAGRVECCSARPTTLPCRQVGLILSWPVSALAHDSRRPRLCNTAVACWRRAPCAFFRHDARSGSGRSAGTASARGSAAALYARCWFCAGSRSSRSARASAASTSHFIHQRRRARRRCKSCLRAPAPPKLARRQIKLQSWPEYRVKRRFIPKKARGEASAAPAAVAGKG